MRSLTPLQSRTPSLAAACGVTGHVSGLAVDPESGVLYVSVESVGPNGVEVKIVRVEVPDGEASFSEVVASFESPVLAHYSLPEELSQVLDVHFLADDRTLAILLRGGDIATLQLSGPDGGVAPVEIIGSVDSGIKAAAWSPDEEQLILVTGEDVLVCMTRTFDILHEEPLRQEDFGEDKFINVGWGSKTTQFHGSLGKSAAKASAQDVGSVSHPTDNGLPVITFRGDAAYFAVSSLDTYPNSSSSRRQIRIYSRDPSSGFIPKLSATSESLPGLEGELCWRPSGNLISGLVRYGYAGGASGNEGRWEVAMLERNGLRHGGFPLREGMETWEKGKVRGMSWNSDSEVLAIWIEREEEDVVQLWSMKNYHYYLKQEIFSSSQKRRLRGLRWHPEKPMSLFILEYDAVQCRTFVWDTYTSRLPIPSDTASVAVVDGDRLLMTPFRTQNTPPPMASFTLSLPSTPVHVAMSHQSDSLAVLGTRKVQVWDLHTRLPDASGSRLKGGGKVSEPALRWEIDVEEGTQIAFGDDQVAVLVAGIEKGCSVVRVHGKDGLVEEMAVGVDVERILWSDQLGWLILDADGVLSSVFESVSLSLPLCPHPSSISISDNLVFALSPSGKLLASPLSSDYSPTTIAASVTSYITTPDFLIYTTSAQRSFYVPLPILRRLVNGEEVSAYESEWESRRVERGSLIVTSSPSEMSLVLQMPRGNLETIYPRPLVLAVVKRDVLSRKYRSAFLTCRKHRLDLNVLYDLDPQAFMANLDDFVSQVPEVDYLNLFVSSLSPKDCSGVLYRDLAHSRDIEKESPEKVNAICDALRTALESRDMVKYVETILTTHVCKLPADYESGLRVLLQLQQNHPEIVEDAIKYIIFLSDVDKLYDVALGMYNFQLVLMVAQYSQKEYLPFLRELKSLDQHEQRFRIDDHLGRRESALRNLQAAGPGKFEDAASYLSRYELYDEAFRIYKNDAEHLPTIHDLYGDYLYDRRDFAQCAIAYRLAGKDEKTLKAYEKAHEWRELFTLAKKLQLTGPTILEMVERVTDHLSSRGKHSEAAQILVEYAKDIESAVDVLCKGTVFSEAYRLASLHDRNDLIDSLILPGLEFAQESLLEVFEEMEGQLDKEIARLKELQAIRRDDPDLFYIVDAEPALEGVDVATNATTAVTNFTRYTVAPTVFSQSTKITGQTNRTRHKPSKRAAGRKGTVDEWDYLLASIGRLVSRVDEKSGEADALLPHLVLAGDDHRELARDLQSTVRSFRKKLEQSIEDSWKDREEILKEAEESGGMGLGGDVKKAREAGVKVVIKQWKGLGVLAI